MEITDLPDDSAQFDSLPISFPPASGAIPDVTSADKDMKQLKTSAADVPPLDIQEVPTKINVPETSVSTTSKADVPPLDIPGATTKNDDLLAVDNSKPDGNRVDEENPSGRKRLSIKKCIVC